MESSIRAFSDNARPLLAGLLPGVILWTTTSGLMGQTAPEAAVIEGAAMETGDTVAAAQPSRLVLGDLAGEGVATRGGVTYERWNNVGGNVVSRNSRQAGKLGLPAMKGIAPSLEFPPNDGKSYASRVRGYFVAPRTGAIRFVLSSDDNSELWLSPGEDPFARHRSAWVAGNGNLGWTKPGEAHRVASQWTPPIQVRQGERYYFEAYHKQADKNDHFSIRMRYEGEKTAVPIPPESLRPYMGVATDADDDGLPDDWQRSAGLTGSEDAGSYADADGDGVSNFDEFIARTDPLDPAPVPGMLLWEAWYGLPGNQVVDLVRAERFSGRPDHAVFVASGSTPLITAGYCGSRLSGFLVPAESGEYQLAVAGDDSTELWFSDNESSHRKERVAFGTSWRPKGDWFVTPSQRSKAFFLEAGRSYYFEVIQKDGGPPGWAAIGWKKKDEKSFAEVTPSFLRSPGVPTDDKNRDFLPDQWVTEALQRMPEAGRDRIVFTEQGDPDRDGLPNWLEARLATNPLEKSQVIGTLVREWWLNVPGRSLAESRNSGVFLKRPSMVEISRGASSEAYTADWYASRLRGYVVAPVTGKYRFWVSGDDQAEFWLSSDATKFQKRLSASVMPESWQASGAQIHTKRQDWDARPGQESAVIDLKAGESYFIELLLKDSGGDDHVALAWQHCEEGSRIWSERGLVSTDALLSFEGDEDDLDDDYLPDSWESQHGLDPEDNGLKDPKKQGEAGDHDGDGLTNREEFLLGTNPCSPDTDGDGVGDYDETRIYCSDPLRKDASPPVKHAELAMDAFAAEPGNWFVTPDGQLRSTSRRGAVDFVFETGTPGVYLIELDAKVIAAEGFAPPVPVIARVDDVEIGTGKVTTDGGKFQWLTPWLDAGSHKVTIDNRNVRLGVALEIISLTVYRHDGEDLNGNSLPDWMEGLFRRLNGIANSITESAVSPVCLEGESRFLTDSAISVAGDKTELKPGLEGRWFADVALARSGDTAIRASFEGGAINEELAIRWSETNLFATADKLVVRAGDSLKVTALPDGADAGVTSSILTINGTVLEQLAGSAFKVVKFDEPGTFRLSTDTMAGPEKLSASVEVEVVDADFGAPFDLATGAPRTWKIPGIPHDLALEADSGLVLERTSATKVMASHPEPRPGSPRVLARLWDTGPVVAATNVNVFRIVNATETRDVRVVGILPDGTRVLEISYLIDGVVPADLSIWLEFFVTDAVFENGDTRYELTAADFDENGLARIKMYKAPGDVVAYICHWMNPYGDNADEETVPEEVAE